jgi:hypothetical protein
MSAKMPTARDNNGATVTVEMVERARVTDPLAFRDLRCRYCEAPVVFVSGYTCNVGEDIRVVLAIFRLAPKKRHSEGCPHNLEGELKIIARQSERRFLRAIARGRYEFRLLAPPTSRTFEPEEPQNWPRTGRGQRLDEEDRRAERNKIYLPAKTQLSAYINCAMTVVQLRARCEADADLEGLLQLKFGSQSIEWRNFYFEYEDYFRAFDEVTCSQVPMPIAVRGAVYQIVTRPAPPEIPKWAVLNLARPHRPTAKPDVRDAACFSIWSRNLRAFEGYNRGQEILAFGVCGARPVDKKPNKNSQHEVKFYRDHELSLWPELGSQVCAFELSSNGHPEPAPLKRHRDRLASNIESSPTITNRSTSAIPSLLEDIRRRAVEAWIAYRKKNKDH